MEIIDFFVGTDIKLSNDIYQLIVKSYSIESILKYMFTRTSIDKINVDGMTALVYFISVEDIPAIKVLLKYKASTKPYKVSGFKINPLLLTSNRYIIELLLKNGANPNELDTYGNNLIGSYIINHEKYTDIVLILDLLLRYGANPNHQNFKMETPLMLSIIYKNINIMIALLSHDKVDVNIQNKFKHTALMLTVLDNAPVLTEIVLLRKDVDINLYDTDGTPLMNAIKLNYKDVINILVKNGADPSFKTDKNSCAYDSVNTYVNKRQEEIKHILNKIEIQHQAI